MSVEYLWGEVYLHGMWGVCTRVLQPRVSTPPRAQEGSVARGGVVKLRVIAVSLAPLRQWRVSLHTGFVSLTLVLVACIPVSTLPSPGCSENS